MSSVSKIPKLAFQVASGTLAGVVLLAALVRVAVQLKNRGRLFLSDAFLVFACACLCAGTGLLYRLTESLYLLQALAQNPFSVALPPDFTNYLLTSLKFLFAYQTVMWTVVFSVKFAFLAFFRHLIRRLAKLKMWWIVTVITTALSWGICAVDVFIICPSFDLSSFTCANVPFNRKAQPISALVICVDVVTDAMIISIPIILLWNAKIKPRQKIGLLLSLCLSISMIVIAVVRTTAIPRAHVTQDVPFEIFLLQLEGCIAVLMASVSAFRSLFASEGSRGPRKKPTWSSREKLWYRGKRPPRSDSETRTNGLPSIPSATMTGLRTFINGGPKSTTMGSRFEESSDDWPLAARKPETTHTRSTSAGEDSNERAFQTELV